MSGKKLFRDYLFILILVLAGCTSTEPVESTRPTNTSDSSRPASTTTTQEQVWNFKSDILATGQVISVQEAALSFIEGGVIVEFLVAEGDNVKAGDILARLDSSEYDIDVTRAEADLAIAQARLDKLLAGPHEALIEEAESEIAAIELQDPLSPLINNEDIAAAQARLDFLLAQPLPEDVNIAQSQVEQAKIILEAAKLQQKRTELVAPFDGTITKINYNCFEYAGTGQPVIQLSNFSHLKVEFVLTEFEIVDLIRGDRALISFNALGGFELDGSVANITPDERTTSGGMLYTIRVEFDDPPPVWVRPGMTVEIVIRRD
jgi:multidrug resistance efflux pump